jgi:hypothetical protein
MSTPGSTWASPATLHYEQLVVEEAIGEDAPGWDGVALLSFESAAEWTAGMFSGPDGKQAIMDDLERFLDVARGETLCCSEFVYRDRSPGRAGMIPALPHNLTEPGSPRPAEQL